MDVDKVLERFLTLIHNRFTISQGKTMFNAILVDIDETNGQATSIERIDREVSL